MAIKDIYDAVIGFDGEKVVSATKAEIEAGTDLSEILNQGLIAPMDEVGVRFSAGDLFVPEMLMAAHIMKEGLNLIKPLLSQGASENRGTVVIGTVKGDLHDIGKNLVAMMMEGAGFTVVDLGVDVEAETFIQQAEEHGARIVALSALLTTTMPAMESTIKRFREAGSSVKVIVGGAPVNNDFAQKIQADGYAPDAPSAVELARKLLVA